MPHLYLALITKTLSILFIALISPGPDFVMVLRNSLNFGKLPGVITALGIACGCLISFTLVIFGIKMLFTYHIIEVIMSIVCGAYLIYMGVGNIKSKPRHEQIKQHRHKPVQLLVCFKNGIMTNIFNPKLYTMVAAVLTYTEKYKPNIASNVAITISQALITFLWFSAVSLTFSHNKIQGIYLSHERHINILVGVIFIILGLSIIFK